MTYLYKNSYKIQKAKIGFFEWFSQNQLMVVQRVFWALGRKGKVKERYMQPDAGNTTAIYVSVARRRHRR